MRFHPTLLRTACVFLLAAWPAIEALAADLTASGIFLVAARELRDPNFRETVVLVTQPGGGEPFGVIINRPLRPRLSEIFPEHEMLKGRQDVVYFGGPVTREGLVFLVRSNEPPPHAVHVLSDVYFSNDPDWIDGMLKRVNPTEGMRVYAGHAGWAPGQLQNEIAQGGWHVVPADANTIFDKDASTIWPDLIKRTMLRHTRAEVPVPAFGNR